MNEQRRRLFVAVLLAWLPNSGAVANGDAPTTRAYLGCKMSQGLFACDAYARQGGAVVYAKPDAQSRVLDKVDYGGLISITTPASKVADAEWIQTDTVLENPDLKAARKTVTYAGYVPRSQVLLDTDFRKVTGCWPVKHFVDPEGGSDYHPGEVYFTSKGIASYPHHPVTVEQFGEQQTYYAEGVFTVRHKRYLNRGYVGHAVLDYANGTITATSGKALKAPEHVQWFSPDDLKGCTSIPTVDPNSHAPNPKDYFEDHG